MHRSNRLGPKCQARRFHRFQPPRQGGHMAQSGTMKCPRKGAIGFADKTIETDYWIAGPGDATRNPVGRGQPQTPAHEGSL